MEIGTFWKDLELCETVEHEVLVKSVKSEKMTYDLRETPFYGNWTDLEPLHVI